MDSKPRELKIEDFGDYMTLRAASRMYKTTHAALYQWLRYHDKLLRKVGSTIVVRHGDLVGYVPKER
jgi:hypothetical protein